MGQNNNREIFVFFTAAFPGREVLGTAEIKEGGLMLDEAGYCVIYNPFIITAKKIQENSIATPQGQPSGGNINVFMQVPSGFAAGAPLHAKVDAFQGPLKDPQLRTMYSQQVKELRMRAAGLVSV